MRYRDEQYVLDTLDDIRKETHENNIMLQHICSYINNVLSTRKNDEQNAFEQNVVANLVSELLHNIKVSKIWQNQVVIEVLILLVKQCLIILVNELSQWFLKQVLQCTVVDMEKAALYKLEILFLKIIPMVLAGCFLANTILSYFGIETEVLSYIAGIGILPLLFIYLSSFVFKFCVYHRMFIYYIFTNNIICFIDDKYGIPISYRSYLVLHLIVAATFLFIILYLKFKLCKH